MSQFLQMTEYTVDEYSVDAVYSGINHDKFKAYCIQERHYACPPEFTYILQDSDKKIIIYDLLLSVKRHSPICCCCMITKGNEIYFINQR